MRTALLLAALAITSEVSAGEASRFRCTSPDGAVSYSTTVCPPGGTCLAFTGNKWSAEACDDARDPKPAGFVGNHRDPCRNDLKCWWEKHRYDGEGSCLQAVEARARYEYRWESRWTQPKFHLLSWSDKAAGTVNIGGMNISMKNAFGVWQRMKYVCSYSTVNDSVVDVAVGPAAD